MALREEGYWDEHYERELRNYLEDGDEGEIWFGKRLNRKIADWLLERLGSREDNANVSENKRLDVIDIGCGNSFLLCTLMEKFQQQQQDQKARISLNALGIDYSLNSISLSSKIVQDRQLSDWIHLKVCDLTDQDQVGSITNEKKFDFIIDKGTYDAICLLNAVPEDRLARTKEAYLRSIRALSKPGTIFIFASCNHTEEELLSLFDSSPTDGKPKLIGRIDTPSIQFGGKSGSQVTCLILEFIVI